MRDDVDYRAFLRRFAAPREVLAADEDAFDYGFYSYGLRLYGNMPLVEPPDTPVVLSLIHISEPTRPRLISYAVFCLKKKKKIQIVRMF